MRKFKIVGAHFRPPAKVVLHNLAVGTELQLIPEPDNPHDPNAIAVHLDPNNIAEDLREDMDNALASQASSMDALLEMETVHLGYIPRVEAEHISLPGPVYGTLSCEGKDFFIEADI